MNTVIFVYVSRKTEYIWHRFAVLYYYYNTYLHLDLCFFFILSSVWVFQLLLDFSLFLLSVDIYSQIFLGHRLKSSCYSVFTVSYVFVDIHFSNCTRILSVLSHVIHICYHVTVYLNISTFQLLNIPLHFSFNFLIVCNSCLAPLQDRRASWVST